MAGNRASHRLTGTGAEMNLTTRNDRFTGTNRSETIHGLAGNDTILGQGGDDLLQGDAGNDTLYGAAGIDDLRGGEGNDTLIDTGGISALYGGNGNDIIRDTGPIGGEDADTWIISGGAGNDTIFSSKPSDDGEPVVWGGKGVDSITLGFFGQSLGYNQGDTPTRETVRGFDYEDRIYLRETAGAHLAVTDNPNGVYIDYGNVHILLAGVHDAEAWIGTFT
jgi:RTX calcium-binding nonapeptide repeat (4 copies)